MLLQEGKEEDDMDGMEAIDIDQESDKWTRGAGRKKIPEGRGDEHEQDIKEDN